MHRLHHLFIYFLLVYLAVGKEGIIGRGDKPLWLISCTIPKTVRARDLPSYPRPPVTRREILQLAQTLNVAVLISKLNNKEYGQQLVDILIKEARQSQVGLGRPTLFRCWKQYYHRDTFCFLARDHILYHKLEIWNAFL